MKIFSTKTELEKDLAAKDESLMRCGEAVHNLACVLKNENSFFWSIPTDRLLAIMNHDIKNTQVVFDSNRTLAEVVNATLDAIDDEKFAIRAPISPGRDDIKFNGKYFTTEQL